MRMKHLTGLNVVVFVAAVGSLTAPAGPSPARVAARPAVGGVAARPRMLNTKWIYVADFGTGKVTVWSPRGKLHKTFFVKGHANAVAVNRKRWLYALGGFSEVNVFERGATTPFERFFQSACGSLSGLAAGDDGTLYVTTQSCEGSSYFGGVYVFPPG
jgi:hypothetical protein